MNPTSWKWTNALRRFVQRINADGKTESCSVEREDVQAFLAGGGAILEPDPPPPPTADEVEEDAALGNAALVQVATMTVAEIDAHIDATFPSLTAAQRTVLKVYGKGIRILLRKVFTGRL